MPKIVPCYFLQGKATKTHTDRGLYDDPVWSFLSNIDFSVFFSLLAGNRGVGDGFDYHCVRHHALSFQWRFPGSRRFEETGRANVFPPWQYGRNNDTTDHGFEFTVPQVDVLADFQGDPISADLVLYV